MPLYDLVCLTGARAGREAMKHALKRAGEQVQGGGGVVTEVRSYGRQPLAYAVRRLGVTHTEAHYAQMSFAAGPNVIPQIQHELRVDDRVLRSVLVKRRLLPPLPARRLRRAQLRAADAAGASGTTAEAAAADAAAP